MLEARSFRGPVPSPEDLQAYEQVLPGCADRLIALTERQATHRQEVEKVMVRTDSDLATRGQVLGFVLAMTVIVGGLVLIAVGRDVEGFGTLIATLTTLVGVFVYTRIRDRQKSPDHADDVDATPGTDLASRPAA